MAPLYQDPETKLCIRFSQLSLYERPVTQGPWDWKFESETLEPYVRPGTPMPSSRKAVPEKGRRRKEPSKVTIPKGSKDPKEMSDEEVQQALLRLLQDPRKGGKTARLIHKASQG